MAGSATQPAAPSSPQPPELPGQPPQQRVHIDPRHPADRHHQVGAGERVVETRRFLAAQRLVERPRLGVAIQHIEKQGLAGPFVGHARGAVRHQPLAEAEALVIGHHMEVVEVDAVARFGQRHQATEAGRLAVHAQDGDDQRRLGVLQHARAPGGEALGRGVVFEVFGGNQAAIGAAPAVGVQRGQQVRVSGRGGGEFDIGHGRAGVGGARRQRHRTTTDLNVPLLESRILRICICGLPHRCRAIASGVVDRHVI